MFNNSAINLVIVINELVREYSYSQIQQQDNAEVIVNVMYLQAVSDSLVAVFFPTLTPLCNDYVNAYYSPAILTFRHMQVNEDFIIEDAEFLPYMV